MSQDDITPAIQACFALVKEVQRRVDSASSGTIDPELRQQLKLAKADLMQATRREVSLTTSAVATSDSSQSYLRSSNGGLTATTATTVTPPPLTSSCDSTAASAHHAEIFHSAPLWSIVLCCFYWNKRKLADQALTAVQLLLRCKAVELSLTTTLFLSPYAVGAGGVVPLGGGAVPLTAGQAPSLARAAAGSGYGGPTPAVLTTSGGGGGKASGLMVQTKAMCRVGEGAYVVLSDYLGTASEPAVQLRLMGILQSLIEGRGQAFFVSKSVTRTVHAAITVALQTSQDVIRSKSQQLIRLCVTRVTKGFVLESLGSANGAGGFATSTLLDDYTVDVEYDGPVVRIHVAEAPPPLPGGTPANASMSACPAWRCSTDPAAGPDEASVGPVGSAASFTPTAFFRSSLDERVVRDAVGVLSPERRLPQLLKDLIMLIKHACKLATRPITGSPTEGNAEVRTRTIALRMLVHVFQELPVANCEAEHRCATWLGLVLTACRYDILRALVRNCSTVAPFAFFELSMQVLTQILRKCHYHMARDLHTLLAVFLFPLVRSPLCDFRPKHAVLSMVHELFSIPHLVVSLFINYDCSPTFDAGGEYGGMLELLLDFVVDLTFMDIVAYDGDEDEDGLTSDQQQLLRGECVVALHALVRSLHRWISEDPQTYARDIVDAEQGGPPQPPHELVELYLDNWEPTERGADPAALAGAAAAACRDSVEAAASTDGGGWLGRMVSSAADVSTSPLAPPWARYRNIHYHWKHVHYLLHSKRTALMAVELINVGKWKEAKAFLEARRYVPSRRPGEAEEVAITTGDVSTVPPGSSSYAELARFISEYPGVSREAISGVFDRINKDPASKLLLRDYLSNFRYGGVPMDVAMRDTTCKFMSWDRPMFESQVWATIQTCFGEAYAKQNPAVITAKDADTMAGVLLFLHANLHNEVAKSSRFVVDQFVDDANACLDFPMDGGDLRAMFARVARHKWQLDAYGRTPTEAERATTAPSISFKIMTECLLLDQAQRASEVAAVWQSVGSTVHAMGREGAAEEGPAPSLRRGSLTASIAAGSSPAATPLSARRHAAEGGGRSDIALLNPVAPAYVDSKDTMKLREERHIAYAQTAGLYARKLEAVHMCHFSDGDAYHPQPYLVPHYAEHVRPILLHSYPSIMACVYMGFRVLEAAPISHQLADIIQVLYNIAAAFVVNLGDLNDAVRATIQRCLTDERAYRLPPVTRTTFVPYLLNFI